MGFLDNYLTVNEKVKLAHEKFPNLRIVANIIEHDLGAGFALVQADFYRDAADPVPAFRDFAYGNVAFYPNNMKRWFIEDTTSSAIGRVISVALATNEKPNRETMEAIEKSNVRQIDSDDQGAWGIKAAKQEDMPTAATSVEELSERLGSEVIDAPPVCEHGRHRIFKTGKKANGDEWGGWFCVEKPKDQQCQVAWAVRSASNGMNWRLK